jgi:Hg(II)-responsive transcriptional regulator
MRTLKIGELARAAGVNVQTVRYYERRGLLEEPPRRASGYREYPESDVARLGFIRRAQALGFTLTEIGDLLSLRVDPRTTSADVHRRVEEKLADVEEKLADLRRIRGALRELAASCKAHGPVGDCPFLEALEAQADAAGDAEAPR